MTGLRDLVALLYRADWTQLSLSGELTTRADRSALPVAARASRTGPPASPDAEAPPQWQETTSSVLVAPGGRFRVENPARDDHRDVTVCDGESCWRLLGDWAARQEACLGDPALAQLLDPSWLLAAYDLEETGTIEAGGRAGLLRHRHAAAVRPARRPAGPHRCPGRRGTGNPAPPGDQVRRQADRDGALEPVTMQPDRVA